MLDIFGIRKLHAIGNHASCTRSLLAVNNGFFGIRRMGLTGMRGILGSSGSIDAAKHLEHHGDARCVVVRAFVEGGEPAQGNEHHGNEQEHERHHAQQRKHCAHDAQASCKHDVAQQNEEWRSDDRSGGGFHQECINPHQMRRRFMPDTPAVVVGHDDDLARLADALAFHAGLVFHHDVLADIAREQAGENRLLRAGLNRIHDGAHEREDEGDDTRYRKKERD